jgi:hypothetical protein
MNFNIKKMTLFMGTITLWHGPYLCPYIEEKTNNLFRNLHFNLQENKIKEKNKKE